MVEPNKLVILALCRRPTNGSSNIATNLKTNIMYYELRDTESDETLGTVKVTNPTECWKKK